jgi:hypothetical protein
LLGKWAHDIRNTVYDVELAGFKQAKPRKRPETSDPQMNEIGKPNTASGKRQAKSWKAHQI